MLTSDDIAYLSNTLSFWDHISENDKELIIQQTLIKEFEKGTTIYNGSTECVGVIIVKAGVLRTYMLSDEGKEITLYRLKNDDICVLSASCLLKNITFEVQIDADTTTQAYVIGSNLFSKLIQHNVYVENFMYKITIDKFSDVMWTMEQILFMSFDERLAVFLLDELSGKKSTTIHMTHSQIATYIGSAREVVSRMLKYFEEEGIVTLFRGGITIMDKNKLNKIVFKK